jgi:mannan endo-1,4-beta-mannosidase
MKRFAMLATTAAIVLAAAVAPATANAANLVPRHGVLWGAFPNEPSGVAGLQARVGRKLAVYIKYEPWTFSHWKNFNRPLHHHRVPIISWSAAPTTNAAAIANGSQDKIILRAAKHLKALKHPLFLRPFYEFDQPSGHPRNIGTPATVIAAWRRTFRLFRSAGAANVRFVWSPMAFDFANHTAQQFWPGRRFLNWIGPDGYNFPGKTWNSWPEIFNTAYKFSLAHNVPMMIPEVASPVNDPRTPGWITKGAKWIRHHTGVKSVTWFDSISPKGYNFQVMTNRATLKAFRAWGKRRFFHAFAH